MQIRNQNAGGYRSGQLIDPLLVADNQAANRNDNRRQCMRHRICHPSNPFVIFAAFCSISLCFLL
jgi:hypothetical protein